MDADAFLHDKLGGAHPGGKQSVRLWLRLLTCTTLIEREIVARFREEFDTTLPRFDFLAALDRGGELTLGEVSRLLMVTNANITGLATRLKADGLIEAGACRGDRRAQYVRLTPEGRSRFQQMAKAHEGWVESLFSQLSTEDADTLLDLLDRAKRSVRRAVHEEDRPA
jgi:DNA-binding MarR family transcriptional regulator